MDLSGETPGDIHGLLFCWGHEQALHHPQQPTGRLTRASGPGAGSLLAQSPGAGKSVMQEGLLARIGWQQVNHLLPLRIRHLAQDLLCQLFLRMIRST